MEFAIQLVVDVLVVFGLSFVSGVGIGTGIYVTSKLIDKFRS